MRIGTRSLLVGSHQFILHPIFVAVAWRRLYGRWPDEAGIWLAILLHDTGYWSLPNLDGPAGECHPQGGARRVARWAARRHRGAWKEQIEYRYWYWFTASHSRSYAERLGWPTSPLMRADKLATALYPRWLYTILLAASGEWREYVTVARAKGYTVPGDVWGYAGWLQQDWILQFSPQAGDVEKKEATTDGAGDLPGRGPDRQRGPEAPPPSARAAR